MRTVRFHTTAGVFAIYYLLVKRLLHLTGYVLDFCVPFNVV